MATWQPSCHKDFEQSGFGRKFLDLSPAIVFLQFLCFLDAEKSDLYIFAESKNNSTFT